MLLDVLHGAPSKHGNFMRKTVVSEVLRGPRGVKIGPQRPLGAHLELLGLLQASWGDLRRLRGPKRQSRKRLLAGTRRLRRLISAILRAKRFPKWIPKASQIEIRNSSRAKKKNMKSPSAVPNTRGPTDGSLTARPKRENRT